MSVFAFLVASLSEALDPLFGAAATAAAIVAFTLCVRLALHPLARAAVRGERVRARLAPRMAEVQRKHGKDPERLRREMSRMYAEEGASPVAGCLPMVLQLPFFFVMYHLFTTDEALLSHTLLGAPLGGRWTDALGEGGVFGQQGLVYLGLFALIAAVATWTYLRTRRLTKATADANAASGAGAGTGAGAAAPGVPGGAAMARVLPLLAFGTLVTAAVVPLAAGLYVATTTAWTAVERAALGAGKPPQPATVADGSREREKGRERSKVKEGRARSNT
ncbi:YidC/Oxa1 family membrane protein insertase [Streptomyces daliensis]|uniref:Membrane protein insertase YidC n=1 Tax=Streptomyces daliensis TaxID=299421 RepID=A0A8T4IMW5_9ACTN|nr:membrane protein insertase YidC [Streptomyces daliensis]